MSADPFKSLLDTQERLLQVKAEMAAMRRENVINRQPWDAKRWVSMEADVASLELDLFRLNRAANNTSRLQREARRNSVLGHLTRLLEGQGLGDLVKRAQQLAATTEPDQAQ